MGKKPNPESFPSVVHTQVYLAISSGYTITAEEHRN